MNCFLTSQYNKTFVTIYKIHPITGGTNPAIVCLRAVTIRRTDTISFNYSIAIITITPWWTLDATQNPLSDSHRVSRCSSTFKTSYSKFTEGWTLWNFRKIANCAKQHFAKRHFSCRPNERFSEGITFERHRLCVFRDFSCSSAAAIHCLEVLSLLQISSLTHFWSTVLAPRPTSGCFDCASLNKFWITCDVIWMWFWRFLRLSFQHRNVLAICSKWRWIQCWLAQKVN